MTDRTSEQRITDLLLRQYNLRVQPAMGRYILRKLHALPKTDSIPVIGGNARTGVAIRQLLATADLNNAMNLQSLPRA